MSTGSTPSELGWLHKWWPMLSAFVLVVAFASIAHFRVDANAGDIEQLDKKVEANSEDIEELEDHMKDESAKIQLQLRDVQHSLELQGRESKQQDEKLDQLLDAVRGN